MVLTNSLTGGGAERSMNLVSNELFNRGWPIVLVPINRSDLDLITPLCEIFSLNREWRGNLFDTLSAIRKLDNLVDEWEPDIIILNCDLPELFGATLRHRKRLVFVEHSSFPWGKRALLGKIVRRILLLRGATPIAVSSHLRIWPKGQIPSCVLQNPLR
ncbi:MAG: hypothetical protein D4R50_01700, partial [Actinomycetales bacterium]